jgi:EpsI family protein
VRVRPPDLAAFLTLALAIVLVRALAQQEPAGVPRPLGALPLALGPWQGETDYFEPEVVATLRADDYLLRRYRTRAGEGLWLYVGYWGAQRLGQTRVHSPSVCLPGAGWIIARYGTTPVRLPGGATITVNSDVVQRGADRQVVLYWYQIHGKVVAGEMGAISTLAWTSLTTRRSDEAVVRITAPISRSAEDTLREEVAFVQTAFPPLARLLPQ